MPDRPFRVVSFAATFGVFTKEPKERLEATGCEVIIVKHDRPLTKSEMISYARGADAVILGGGGMSEAVMDELPGLKVIASMVEASTASTMPPPPGGESSSSTRQASTPRRPLT